VQALAADDRRVTATMGRTGTIDDGRRSVAGVWDTAAAGARFLGWLTEGRPQEASAPDGSAALPAAAGSVGVDDVVVVALGSVATARDRVVALLQTAPDVPMEIDRGVLSVAVSTQFRSEGGAYLKKTRIRALCTHGKLWCIWGDHADLTGCTLLAYLTKICSTSGEIYG
jgi:hypothetical protein